MDEEMTLQEKHRRIVGLRFIAHPWVESLLEPRLSAAREALVDEGFTPEQTRVIESEPIPISYDLFTPARRRELAPRLRRICRELESCSLETAMCRVDTLWRELPAEHPTGENSPEEREYNIARDALLILSDFLAAIESLPT